MGGARCIPHVVNRRSIQLAAKWKPRAEEKGPNYRNSLSRQDLSKGVITLNAVDRHLHPSHG
jgi:hypothetical protein